MEIAEYVIDHPDKGEGIPIYRIGKRTPNGIDWFEGASSLKDAKARLAGAKADAATATPIAHKSYQEHVAALRSSRKPHSDPTVEEAIRYQERQIASYRANSPRYKQRVESLAKARKAKKPKS